MSEQNSENGLFAKINEKVQVTNIGGVAFSLMLLLLIAVLSLNALPKNMGGALFALVILGGVFFFVGNNTPILKSYLGGGSALAVVAGSAMTAMGMVPAPAVADIKSFISNTNFLEFYIVALICSAILKMDRDLLLKSAVRFLPVAFGAMIIAFFVTSFAGMAMGFSFKHAALYISFPMMAGGIGAGIVPLSASYAGALHQSAGDILNQLFPAVVIANLLAIIGSSLLVKFTAKSKMNGQGQLLKTSEDMGSKKKEEAPAMNNKQLLNGMMVALTFYIMGNILFHFIPQINAFAFMILLVILAKAFNLVPKFYEQSAAMFGGMITSATTPALLAGIGLALVDMNKLLQTVTWQLVVCSLISVITIGIAGGLLGKLFGLYPVESAIAGGMINNSMGGTGNVAVLSASDRMGLIAFAQMGNRIGGAIILVLGGLLITMM
ncbi:2-hydroxycarboxylate transporter family protein [Fructobacillus sp. M2-14]|uniref:2-hydroxycarboxylate transporter family protein n=1 Tax=Fructobacillus broussonetiae TaxID=2713173 RepID=A0ABS5QZ67_9LACO|nr:2-hydroxycarboxylate transporter family protein [Fructobacillus broussonetiae]MBS9338498.1 2-hydroxycarboxylate transporter family protein [Fructobacillus broussonetiae]